MTPLTEALTAAQRRALASLERAYVNDLITDQGEAGLFDHLQNIGLGDQLEGERLRDCLDVLKAYGSPVEPAAAGPKEEPMSDKQRSFITQLLDEKHVDPSAYPDSTGLTKAQASDLINSLQAGTYDPAKWRVPYLNERRTP